MNQGKYVFAQLMAFVSHNDFNRCVTRYSGDYKVKDFSCWNQFLCMAFGQLTHRESLSDTISCLKINSAKLYHLGIRRAVVKSTLSIANEKRNWRIYQDFALTLIEEARQLYSSENQLELDIKQDVFALDATVIDLCLNLFRWAKHRRRKAAVKIHTLLDLKTSIPEIVFITGGSTHDVNILDMIQFQQDSYYVMDRAYIDFRRLHRLHLANAYFILRAKSNFKFVRLSSKPVDKTTGVRCDQIVRLKNQLVLTYYPDSFRRIKYYDSEQNRMFVFLTNNTQAKATEIAYLYKCRWQIEVFFKWIKQHLKIKSFWGHNPNAVKTQIWIAISVYVLVIIVKKKLNLPHSMYEILQIVSTNIFDKTPLNELFSKTDYQNIKERICNQLYLF